MNQECSFCQNCGNSLDSESRFCDTCGYDLFQNNVSITKTLNGKSKLKSLFFPLLLIGLIINGYFLVQKHNKLENILVINKKIKINLEKKLDKL